MRNLVAMGLWLAAAMSGGCVDNGDGGDDPGDGELDSFGGGKADSAVSEGSVEACRIEKLVNLAGFDELDDDARLDRRAARAIVAVREGADGLRDTDDDGWFVTRAQLDAVPWVGPRTYKALREYAKDHPAYRCGSVDVQLLAFNDVQATSSRRAARAARSRSAPSRWPTWSRPVAASSSPPT